MVQLNCVVETKDYFTNYRSISSVVSKRSLRGKDILVIDFINYSYQIKINDDFLKDLKLKIY